MNELRVNQALSTFIDSHWATQQIETLQQRIEQLESQQQLRALQRKITQLEAKLAKAEGYFDRMRVPSHPGGGGGGIDVRIPFASGGYKTTLY